jgi:hypothetical protein
MAGLGPAIHVFAAGKKRNHREDVDCRPSPTMTMWWIAGPAFAGACFADHDDVM